MTNRRQFFAFGASLLALSATGALAQDLPAREDLDTLPPELAPREVDFNADLPAGEIHVMPDEFALYFTLEGGRAIRYSCGIGKEGLYEAGTFVMQYKEEWPTWTPTPDMVERDPDKYGKYAEDGMPGGPDNPLGARALYLFTADDEDTYLRIHGTNEPDTIGQAVSNGCARLVNGDIADLYDHVAEGAKVVLHPQA